jgi:hypothetical protein
MAKSHGRPRGRKGKPPSKVPPHIRRDIANRHARRRQEERKAAADQYAALSTRTKRILAGAEDLDAPSLATGQLELARAP